MAINFATGGSQTLPSNVIQAKQVQAGGSTYCTSNGNHTALYGLSFSNRVYVDLCNVTITPLSASSTIVVIGMCGMSSSNLTYHNTGAYGLVAVKDNGSNGNIDNTDYQYYPLTNLTTNMYLPNTDVQGHHQAGNTNAQTWYLKGYSYAENSNTNRVNFRDGALMLLEVA